MGSWGSQLYQDDLALDIKDYYNDQLYSGIDEITITENLLKQYQIMISDVDDAPIFWFALADTQWNLGRLEETVKETALKYIETELVSNRWETENSKKATERKQMLKKLQNKLLSSQPSPQKIPKHRVFHCEWKKGDVYAYKLESDLAKETGLYGRYLLIQKIDEGMWHPGHIVPIVYVKITNDEKLPYNEKEFDQLEYIQTGFTKYEDRFYPIDMSRPQEDIFEKSKLNYHIDEYGFLQQYRIMLISTSKKNIPSKLIYLGNFPHSTFPQKEFIPHSKISITSTFWEKFDETFETKLLKLYQGHNLRKFSVYRQSSD